MTMSGVIARTLRKVAENPEEFIAPGIGDARKNYQVLRELYDGLSARLESGGIEFPGSMHYVRRQLRSMERNLAEAADGYSLCYELYSSENIGSILNSLAFVEKYFAPRQ